MPTYEQQQHFVTFYSPGTFVAETTDQPIDEWDTAQAVEMADEIVERHGARPYGFRFTTRARTAEQLDSERIASSGMYYIGGMIETVDDVRANQEGRPALLSNIEANGWDRVVTTTRGYRWTQPLRPGDAVLCMCSV